MSEDITPPDTDNDNKQSEEDFTSVPVNVKPVAPVSDEPIEDIKPAETPAPSDQETTPAPEHDTAAAPENVAQSFASVDTTEKPHWVRRGLFVAILLLLLGGAVLAATKLTNSPAPVKPAATKHDVSLLRVGIVTQFQPVLYPKDTNLSSQIDVDNQVFDSLVTYKDKTKLEPQLALSWSNPDNSTWVFKLRHNVKFHNGNSLTSKQVKASLEAPQTSDYKQYTDTIKQVDASDPYTVTVTTKAADPLLINKLAHLYIFDTDSKDVGQASTGTGPYQFKPGFNQSSTQIQLTAWDGYWGGHAYTREVDFIAYPDDQTATKAIKDGQLDFAVISDPVTAKQAQTAGWALSNKSNVQINFLVLNTLKAGSPLANLKVRQALYQAVDPAALLKVRANVTAAAPTQLVPQEVTGFNPAIKRPAMDLVKAKQLLTDAGYAKGFTTSIVTAPPTRAVVDELVKELAQVGVTATVDQHNDSKSFFAAAFSGNADMVFIGYQTDLLDASDSLANLAIDTPNYKNTQLDATFQQSQTTVDVAKRIKLLQDMESTVMQDLPVLPLFQPPAASQLAHSNLVFSTQNFNSDTGLYFWQVYNK